MLFETLRSTLSEPDLQRAQVLVGPRQVGKTTLLQQLADHFLEGGWPAQNVTYFDFDDDRIERSQGLRAVLEARPVGLREDVPRLLLLDEVTKAPRWDVSLKQMVDSLRTTPAATRARVVVTDSAASLVRGGARESLQGRVDELRIHGLTFGETLDFLSLGEETGREVLARSPGAFERYLAQGGLPEHVAAERLDQTWERIRQDIIDRAIARDLSREVKDIHRVTDLFRALVQDSGGVFSAANRARDLPQEAGRGGEPRAVRSWVGLLEQACLIDRLGQWSPALRGGTVRSSRELKSRPKLFAEDHGFIPAFSPYAHPLQQGRVLGPVFETVVFTHLRDLRERRRDFGLYFFREKENTEIDFVLAFDDLVLGLEVTSHRDPGKEWASAKRAAARAKVDRVIVVHGGSSDRRESEEGAEWPIDDFLLQPSDCIERNLEWIRRSR